MEEFFKENRGAFDDQKPGSHIWPEIRQALFKQKPVHVLWKAAAVLFFLTSVFLFNEVSSGSTMRIESDKTRSSFVKIENYYTDQIQLRESWLEESNGYTALDLRGEYARLLAMYEVLRMEWEKNPTVEIQDALTLNLIVRLDLLNKQTDAGRRNLSWN